MVMNNGHEAYQVKGNEAYNNMLANIFPLLWPLGVGSKVFFFFLFMKVVILHIKLTGMKHRIHATK